MDVQNKIEHICFHCAFLNDTWEPCHVTIGFFETTKTSRIVMVLQVNEVLIKHGFNAQVVIYVKDKVWVVLIQP